MVDKADEQIRRAMQAGGFDNLPGKGKPLKLNDNPFEDPEWRLANHVLQTGGFSLPWIETAKEIDADLNAARTDLKRSRDWRASALASGQAYPLVMDEWHRAVERFRERIAAVNKKIFSLNLEVPSAQFQRMQIQADRELDAVTGTLPGRD